MQIKFTIDSLDDAQQATRLLAVLVEELQGSAALPGEAPEAAPEPAPVDEPKKKRASKKGGFTPLSSTGVPAGEIIPDPNQVPLPLEPARPAPSVVEQIDLGPSFDGLSLEELRGKFAEAARTKGVQWAREVLNNNNATKASELSSDALRQALAA